MLTKEQKQWWKDYQSGVIAPGTKPWWKPWYHDYQTPARPAKSDGKEYLSGQKPLPAAKWADDPDALADQREKVWNAYHRFRGVARALAGFVGTLLGILWVGLWIVIFLALASWSIHYLF